MKPLYLDRDSFIAWTQGVLLDFKHGVGVVGDNINHERAEQVLREGGQVFLTINGEPVSELVETEEAYEEVQLPTAKEAP